MAFRCLACMRRQRSHLGLKNLHLGFGLMFAAGQKRDLVFGGEMGRNHVQPGQMDSPPSQSFKRPRKTGEPPTLRRCACLKAADSKKVEMPHTKMKHRSVALRHKELAMIDFGEQGQKLGLFFSSAVHLRKIILHQFFIRKRLFRSKRHRKSPSKQAGACVIQRKRQHMNSHARISPVVLNRFSWGEFSRSPNSARSNRRRA